MRELTLGREPSGVMLARNPEHSTAAARIIVEQDPQTGLRLKYFSTTPDVEYWTRRWKSEAEVSYAREMRGHLPHQLRDTFRRWVAPGARTLEAGCGLGHFTVAAHVLGYAAEGLDWSRDVIEKLRARFAGITWHVGDVRCLEFADDTFDALYSPGVCEHFEEGPSQILAEAHRVLRPGGIAVVSTPCLNPWLQRRIRSRSGPSTVEAPFFQYAFTAEGLAKLLSSLGFEVLQIRPYATLDTFERYAGWRIPGRLRKPSAVVLDYLPVVRQWGSTCIWVVRKP